MFVFLFSRPAVCISCALDGEARQKRGEKGDRSAQSGERQPSEKVKTVHQQIRQRCTIHHVPALSGEAEHKLKQAKL